MKPSTLRKIRPLSAPIFSWVSEPSSTLSKWETTLTLSSLSSRVQVFSTR